MNSSIERLMRNIEALRYTKQINGAFFMVMFLESQVEINAATARERIIKAAIAGAF